MSDKKPRVAGGELERTWPLPPVLAECIAAWASSPKCQQVANQPNTDPKNDLAPLSEIQSWFDLALEPSDPKPPADVYERLARQFQIIINRQNNAQLEREGPVPFERLKDVSLEEERNKRVNEVVEAANQLLFVAEKLEEFERGYLWPSGISLKEIQQILHKIGAFPRRASLPRANRGRPPMNWHGSAREIARLIRDAMRNVGYHERLRMTDAESVTAYVGAAAISWAYGIKIEAAGFATAMQMRDRRRKGAHRQP